MSWLNGYQSWRQEHLHNILPGDLVFSAYGERFLVEQAKLNHGRASIVVRDNAGIKNEMDLYRVMGYNRSSKLEAPYWSLGELVCYQGRYFVVGRIGLNEKKDLWWSDEGGNRLWHSYDHPLPYKVSFWSIGDDQPRVNQYYLLLPEKKYEDSYEPVKVVALTEEGGIELEMVAYQHLKKKPANMIITSPRRLLEFKLMDSYYQPLAVHQDQWYTYLQPDKKQSGN